MVLESPEHGPMLCLGGIRQSLPPQCGDVPITNWAWDAVEGEERRAGTTWGTYAVVGTFDGTSFTVEAVGDPEPEQDPGLESETPCPEPEGGWVASDPGRTSQGDLDRAVSTARGEPDFAGVWVDYPNRNPPISEEDTDGLVLNAAFTGDLERHERELRQRWGGPLCLVRFDRTLAELSRIQNELTGDVGEDLGLHVLAASSYEFENVVEIEVVVIDEATREALDDRYGKGVVRALSALRPVG